MKKLEIIEEHSKEQFKRSVESFYSHHSHILETKFQRNLFYAGVGSSAGRTPGSTQDLTKAKLDELYMAFIVYNEGGA